MPADYLDGLDPSLRAERWWRNTEALDWSASGILVVTAGVGSLASRAKAGGRRTALPKPMTATVSP